MYTLIIDVDTDDDFDYTGPKELRSTFTTKEELKDFCRNYIKLALHTLTVETSASYNDIEYRDFKPSRYKAISDVFCKLYSKIGKTRLNSADFTTHSGNWTFVFKFEKVA